MYILFPQLTNRLPLSMSKAEYADDNTTYICINHAVTQ